MIKLFLNEKYSCEVIDMSPPRSKDSIPHEGLIEQTVGFSIGRWYYGPGEASPSLFSMEKIAFRVSLPDGTSMTFGGFVTLYDPYVIYNGPEGAYMEVAVCGECNIHDDGEHDTICNKPVDIVKLLKLILESLDSECYNPLPDLEQVLEELEKRDKETTP